MLKLQVQTSHGIRNLTRQRDTQALSFTLPGSAGSPDGWIVILPAWQEAASNAYRLSLMPEDEKGQRTTSSRGTIKPVTPLQINPDNNERYSPMPGG